MKTVILGDLHNRRLKCETLFKSIGLMNDDLTRNEGFHVIQLGDVVSLGYDEVEAEFYEWVIQFFDEMLVGNHENPIFWWNKDMDFWGFDPDPMSGVYRGADVEACNLVRKNRDRYKVATTVGKWLITHAGVAAKWQKLHKYKDVPVNLVAEDLNKRYLHCVNAHANDPVISSCMTQGGGIMWIRIEYLANGYGSMHIPQIVGHSGYGGPKLGLTVDTKEPSLWCIDTPSESKRAGGRSEMGGVCAIVTEDDGETWEMHWVRADGLDTLEVLSWDEILERQSIVAPRLTGHVFV